MGKPFEQHDDSCWKCVAEYGFLGALFTGIILFCLFGVGCTSLRKIKPHLTTDWEIACGTYKFCGPHVGVQRSGSTICYIDDITAPPEKQKIRCR